MARFTRASMSKMPVRSVDLCRAVSGIQDGQRWVRETGCGLSPDAVERLPPGVNRRYLCLPARHPRQRARNYPLHACPDHFGPNTCPDARERTFRTEAIVCVADFGGRQIAVDALQPRVRQNCAIASGARAQSRKTGHAELFMRANYLLAQGAICTSSRKPNWSSRMHRCAKIWWQKDLCGYVTELLDKFAPMRKSTAHSISC